MAVKIQNEDLALEFVSKIYLIVLNVIVMF